VSHHDSWTIAQGRQYLIEHRNEGTRCLLCHRNAKVYRRPLNSSMAIVLIELRNYYRGVGFFPYTHVPSFVEGLAKYPDKVRAALRGDWAKLRWWGFLVEAPPDFVPADGTKARSGYWCITQPGLDFAEGKSSSYSHVFEFRGEVLGVEQSYVQIQHCLKKKFNYAELMGGPHAPT
jgi:hypothetical protein